MNNFENNNIKEIIDKALELNKFKSNSAEKQLIDHVIYLVDKSKESSEGETNDI